MDVLKSLLQNQARYAQKQIEAFKQLERLYLKSNGPAQGFAEYAEEEPQEQEKVSGYEMSEDESKRLDWEAYLQFYASGEFDREGRDVLDPCCSGLDPNMIDPERAASGVPMGLPDHLRIDSPRGAGALMPIVGGMFDELQGS